MGNRPTILVVDDSPYMRRIITRVLEQAGYNVESVADGQSALEAIASGRPDLVVLDVMMPGLTGHEVCARIRANPLTATIPVILLTAMDQIHERVVGLKAGADDYITKPFEIEEFTARIAMHLRRSRRDISSNPLTTLPGNPEIMAAIEARFAANQPFALYYIDLNAFKSYNDKYGFLDGDRMIRLLASTIVEAVEHTGLQEQVFVGHEGGDDFVVLSPPEWVEPLVQDIFNTFTERSLPLFHEEDRVRQSFIARDRDGSSVAVPLTSVAIAVVTSRHAQWSSAEELIRYAARVKAYTKELPPPHVAVDPPLAPDPS